MRITLHEEGVVLFIIGQLICNLNPSMSAPQYIGTKYRHIDVQRIIQHVVMKYVCCSTRLYKENPFKVQLRMLSSALM